MGGSPGHLDSRTGRPIARVFVRRARVCGMLGAVAISEATAMSERFIGEEIRPVTGAPSAGRFVPGEPVLPGRFTWRGAEHEIVDVIETHHELGPCRSGSDEQYVRKHWYRVRTNTGREMRIYFERSPRAGRRQWRVFTVSESEDIHE